MNNNKMSFKWCRRGNKCNTKDCTFWHNRYIEWSDEYARIAQSVFNRWQKTQDRLDIVTSHLKIIIDENDSLKRENEDLLEKIQKLEHIDNMNKWIKTPEISPPPGLEN